MLTLRFRDQYVEGGFDREVPEGTAKMQAVYLGDGGIADVILDALAKAGLADGWHTHLAEDDRWGGWIRTPVADATEGRAQCKATTGWCALAGDDVEARMFLAGDRTLSVEAEVRAHDRVTERLLVFLDEVRRRAPTELARGPVLAACTRPTPRVRPRRLYAHWPADAVALIVDRAQLARNVERSIPGGKGTDPGEPRYAPAMVRELDTLTSAPLPPGATRDERDGVVVIDFTGAAATLGAAAAAFERWMLELPLERGTYLDDGPQGDPAAPGAYQLTRAPEGSGFTLYNPYFGQAYSADVRAGRSITNPEKLERLAAAKAAGKLPTGQRVTKAVLLVPTREDAVALAHLVAEGVVDSVAYHDGELPRDPNLLGESVWVPLPEETSRRRAKKKTTAKKTAPKKTGAKKTTGTKKTTAKKTAAKKSPAKQQTAAKKTASTKR
jgi:hypothetical protein